MVAVEFLGEQVELNYPKTRADIEPVIQAQLDLSDGDGGVSAPSVATMIQLAAASIAACTDGDTEHWFGKLYENQHANKEHPNQCKLAAEAMKMCGLEEAADVLGKGQGQSD